MNDVFQLEAICRRTSG